MQENIIETKPPPAVASPSPDTIKPSKISDKKANKSPVSSAISVVSSPPKSEEKALNAPKPAPKEQKPIISKEEVVVGPSKIANSPKAPQKAKQSPQTNKKKSELKSTVNIVSSKVEVKQAPFSSKVNSVVNVKSSGVGDEPAVLVPNNIIGEPEYDFLSRQPSEFVEETYKVINIRPSKTHGPKPKHVHKHRQQAPTPPPDDEEHPIGLVTTLGGTIVKDGLTTVHETSVIGTYISGKYAQVLNSNTKIFGSSHRAKIAPSPPHRILKTVAPSITKNHRFNLEPTPSISDEDTSFSKTTRRQPSGGGSFKNRHRAQVLDNEGHDNAPASQSKKFKNRNTAHAQRAQQR